MSQPRGLTRETAVINEMTRTGWLCGSRRHLAGPGDVLGVRYERVSPIDGLPEYGHEVVLAEVKSTKRPYEHFRQADRDELAAAADKFGAQAWLAWWPPRGQLQWIPEAEWPGARQERHARG